MSMLRLCIGFLGSIGRDFYLVLYCIVEARKVAKLAKPWGTRIGIEIYSSYVNNRYQACKSWR